MNYHQQQQHELRKGLLDFNAKRFDVKNMKTDATVVIIGTRGKGKSSFLKYLFYRLRHKFAYGQIHTDSMDVYYEWVNRFPQPFCYSEFNQDAIQELINHQKAKTIPHPDPEKIVKAPPAFLLLDDVMGSPQVRRSKQITEIFVNGRHLNIFLVVTAQQPMCLDNRMRENVDYCFMLNTGSASNAELLFKHYFSNAIPSFELFCDLAKKLTKKYSMMVMDMSKTDDGMDDAVRYLIPPDPKKVPEFLLGTKRLWKWYNKHKAKEAYKPLILSKTDYKKYKPSLRVNVDESYDSSYYSDGNTTTTTTNHWKHKRKNPHRKREQTHHARMPNKNGFSEDVFDTERLKLKRLAGHQHHYGTDKSIVDSISFAIAQNNVPLLRF